MGREWGREGGRGFFWSGIGWLDVFVNTLFLFRKIFGINSLQR